MSDLPSCSSPARSAVNSPRWLCRPERVFDGERLLTGKAVVVQGDKIDALLPARQAPQGLPVLEAPGCTLLPGLIDMHAHFSRWQGAFNLAWGVTTVRDTGNDLDWMLARRTEWKDEPWPRLYTLGPLLDGPTPVHRCCTRTCNDATAGIEAVKELKTAGVDGVKLYVGIPPDGIAAATRQAHALDLHVTIHTGRALAAGAAGVDEFFHLDGLLSDIWPDNPGGWLNLWGHPGFAETSDRQQQVADEIKRSGMIATPTLAFWDSNCRPVNNDPALAEKVAQAAQGWQAALRAAQGFMRLLYAREVPILAGTDVPCGGLMPGLSLWRELTLLTEAGLPPIAAFRSATSAAADCLRNEHIGRIKPGCQADVVLVKADPTISLTEPPEVVKVVRDGKILDPSELLSAARKALVEAPIDPWESEFVRPVSAPQIHTDEIS